MSPDYASRVASFLPNQGDLGRFQSRSPAKRLLKAFDRLRIWFSLLYVPGGGDEVASLLASAHSKVIEIWILMPLGLIHSSYSALRTVVDICTSYSFYRSHPIEWRAVCDGRAPWEGRQRIVDWHVKHSRHFSEINDQFGLMQALTEDYRKLSNYVHAIPVAGLPNLKGIDRTELSDEDLVRFVELAESVDCNLSLLFLGVSYSKIPSLSEKDYRTVMRGVARSKLAAAGITLPRR